MLVPALIVTMLVAVTSGRVRAVEAAAGAGLLLLAYGLFSRQLTRTLLGQVLDDALALTGALFALLVAATSFSLLLRAFGTDRLVGDAMLKLQNHPQLAVAAVLAALLGCAFVLDAFELIFLVVPIVMPPLLAQVADAAWVAALTLLVLQVGFLLPPAGFAVVLARGQLTPRPGVGPIARALTPYLAWAALVASFVAVVPQSTQWLRSEAAGIDPTVFKPADIERLMREMSAPSPK
jgi:TRAP-type mannitol/chloroaromatic compound transport system permease large subunit